MAFVAVTRRSEYPLGAARTTASVAILLPAPGRFSTMNGWPSRSDSQCASRRAMISGEVPAGRPTITLTERAG